MSTVLEPPQTAWEPTPAELTLGDLVEKFGPIPLSRIRMSPFPGTATEDDAVAIQDRENRSCELIDGILVEKTVGMFESHLAVLIGSLLSEFVRSRGLGAVFGADGMMKLSPGLIRIPDVSYVSNERLSKVRIVPQGPLVPLVPNFAVEVLSRGNTQKEMQDKLEDFFQAGVELVWYVDTRKESVAVYTAVDQMNLIKSPAVLDGGTVLPGFSIELKTLFAPVV
ncbi:MAG: Uma2 family endonuclease [Planctomycetaceae bacterium]|nr:Uma2 family endonuclease [Planctomycetaceae bacterium]